MRFLIATWLLALAAAPAAAQHQYHGGGGPFPPGWHGRTDRDNQSLSDVMFMAMGGGFHIRTGPAVILWNPEHAARGAYTVTATFTQPSTPARLDAYGIFFGGAALDAPDQVYTYFLIRHDGKFIIKHRDGADAPTIVPWSDHDAVHRPDAAGRSTNTLSVEVGTDRIRFLVNGAEVGALDRAAVRAVDGIAGLRVNHGLEVMVDRFSIERK
jgi:hypothetical protein